MQVLVDFLVQLLLGVFMSRGNKADSEMRARRALKLSLVFAVLVVFFLLVFSAVT